MDNLRKRTGYSMLDDMEPAEKERLERTELYRRFLLARKKLDRMAIRAWKTTGRLNSEKVLDQDKLVTVLGEAVLAEIIKNA